MKEYYMDQSDNFLKTYIKYHIRMILAFTIFCVIFAVMFALYHISLEAVLYPAILCAAAGAAFVIYDCTLASRKHKRLQALKDYSAEMLLALGDYDDENAFIKALHIDEYDYRQIIHTLADHQLLLIGEMEKRYADMIDYYTIWAYQIKTPIASMRLILQAEDTENSRRAMEDLQRIEQYVDMVMAFLRLDSDFTDYVFRDLQIDDIIRQVLRKLSTQFIRRKIKLEYEPLNLQVVSDEKWLSFVVEQILSNSLKYTHAGTITICTEEPGILCIRDTGIGIASEDLPRIFDKGYTGYNGRTDKKASGLGLYLCKRICDNLGHNLSAESVVDEYTMIRISLFQKRIEAE